MPAILLTADLMTASKAQGAATRAGCTFKTAASAPAVLVQAAESAATLVILDLSTPGLDVPTLVSQLRALASRPEILAFGPHVHEGLLQAASDAGCDRVIPRGQFHAQADEILATHTASARS